MDNKDKLLAIYEIYEQRVAGYPYACARGCSSCCTQSVTMTGLEGEVALDFINEHNIEMPALAEFKSGACPACTTNEFAKSCLQQDDFTPEADFWSFTPCLFLHDGACSIYAARPFACRSFGSFVKCDETGEAELDPFLITLNTVLAQIIEHLGRGGVWGNMFDVFAYLQAAGQGDGPLKDIGERLRVARPLPGFLVPPEEIEDIQTFLRELAGLHIAGIGSGE